MLLEFRVENYRSFRKCQTLSLVASRDKTHKQTHTFPMPGSKSEHLLSSVVLYGPNASGKSNFIRAFMTLRDLVAVSATGIQIGEKLPFSPFMLHSECRSRPSRFEVLFIQEGIRYDYGVAVHENRVHEEWLTAYPKGRPQRWYERYLDHTNERDEWFFGDALKGEKERIKEFVRPNSLFLSHAAQNNHPQLSKVFRWFTGNTGHLADVARARSYTANMCKDDQEFCRRILDFLKVADLGIEDLKIERGLIETPKVESNMPLPDKLLEDVLKEIKKRQVLRVFASHRSVDETEPVLLDMADESGGTRRLFEFAGPWIDILDNGKVLFVDELEQSLHPLLARRLVTLFHTPKTNPKHAQLICTTHDVSLLEQKELYRRDQIWFVEKDQDGATRLYPLTDFSPRKDESLLRGYLRGRYGATPLIEDVGV